MYINTVYTQSYIVYIYIKKGEKVSNPPCVVPYRISSISKCSRTRQKKKNKTRRYVCLFFFFFFFLWWANGFMFLLLLFVVLLPRVRVCVYGGGERISPSGVLFGVPFSIGLAIVRSIWWKEPAHIVAQHMKRRSSSSNSSYICIYLYFKKRTQQHVINIALSQCHLPHIKKMLLFVFLLLLLAAVKSYESWAAGFEEDLKKKYIIDFRSWIVVRESFDNQSRKSKRRNLITLSWPFVIRDRLLLLLVIL